MLLVLHILYCHVSELSHTIFECYFQTILIKCMYSNCYLPLFIELINCNTNYFCERHYTMKFRRKCSFNSIKLIKLLLNFFPIIKLISHLIIILKVRCNFLSMGRFTLSRIICLNKQIYSPNHL